ncbi:MAG: hypothetical protein U9N54_12790 [candidate division Zixibacteria bacterium]|nr:hypothetical protein [candidate division Zixibacteria bacterium]
MSFSGYILTRKIVTVTLIVTIINICYFSFLNLHLHILPDGRTIVHSHSLPDNNSDNNHDNNHDHSQQEITFYKAFSRIFEVDNNIDSYFEPFILFVLGILDNCIIIEYPSIYISFNTGRAPPIYLFSAL